MNIKTPKPHSQIEMIIAKERLRQAHHSFNAALTATILSTGISILGAGLLLSGRVPEGAFTATSGTAISVACFKLAKDANDRFDKISQELMDDD
ncbi:MAG: hypothetical protein HC916_09430 [Coleofasciculaceae cyanobacterium SM2_1_6]|nr:hypothetical protein [Coleofasciculaceae cyanobacterium SM2_1_6]